MSKEFTKEQCKSIVKTLTAAKKYLWDGQCKKPDDKKVCICHAINSTYPDTKESGEHTLVKRVIANRLGNEAVVEGWLCRVAKIPDHLIVPINVQPYRHRWVDALIQEFSS